MIARRHFAIKVELWRLRDSAILIMTGMGSAFVVAIESALRHRAVTKLRLAVQQENEAALRFWSRRGFAVEGTPSACVLRLIRELA